MSKTLVAYFSASGVTARVAKALAEAAHADLYEIKPETPYTRADLDWRNKRSRSTLEMNDPASRPALSGDAPDMAAYDTVFVGFPIWWYTAPTIVKTFLEACQFTGQTVVPFATSGGSGLGDTVQALAPCCPGATLREGRLLSARPDAQTLKAFVQSV